MKLNILFSILLHTLVSSCFGQSVLWSNFSFKGDFHAIAPLADSNFVLAGGNGESWQLVKIDNDGNVVWQKNMRANMGDCIWDILPGDNEGFLAIGSWARSINHTKWEGKSKLAKFDKNGKLLWEKIYSKENYSYCNLNRIIGLKGKGYLLTGSYNSGKDVSKENMNYDAWIVRVDENGEILWEKTIAGPGTDNIDDIIQLENGQLLLSGISFLPDKQAEDEENCQIMLIQNNTDGTIIGSKVIGGIGFEDAVKIFPTPDGGFLLCGTTDSPDFGKPKLRYDKEDEEDEEEWDEDIFICKVNKNLKLEWVKRYGGTGSDELYDCITTMNGIIIVGHVNSDDGDFTKSKRVGDVVVFKVNWNGKIKWSNMFDRTSISSANAIEKINAEDFILVGKNASYAAGTLAFKKTPKKKK